MDNDSTKFFPNLTDKEMLNQIKLYDYLCAQHSVLQEKMQILIVSGCYDKKATENLNKSKMYYNYLQQDFEMLKVVYRKTGNNNFSDKAQRFKKFVKDWYKVIEYLHGIVCKLEKNNNSQNTR